MLPLVDIHCHLLAGLDDGPGTVEEAVAMCRSAASQGVRLLAATAHQNERWSAVTPERIRCATTLLQKVLEEEKVRVTVVPSAEVTAAPETARQWHAGSLLSIADRGEYLLLEMPHGMCVDLLPTVAALRRTGIRPILAHPERVPDLLHQPGRIEELIEAGCLVQVSSSSICKPRNREDRRALKSWLQRGLVHLLGSDGHSPERRPPLLAPAYHELAHWVGLAAADRIASTNGMAVVHGLPLHIRRPALRRPARSWFARLW
jgi:protein-tyrosine phosphatase